MTVLRSSCAEALSGNGIRFEDIAQERVERSDAQWRRIFERYPTDTDGFAVAFEYNDDALWLPMLRKHCFVVIADVRSRSECEKSIAALFEDMNRRNGDDKRLDKRLLARTVPRCTRRRSKIGSAPKSNTPFSAPKSRFSAPLPIEHC